MIKNIIYYLISLLSPLLLTACTNHHKPQENIVFQKALYDINGDTIYISNNNWNYDNLGIYPFETNGYIAYSLNQVYFYPQLDPFKTFNEYSPFVPVNKIALTALAKSNESYLNINDFVVQNVDLTPVINLGLTICQHNGTNI